MASKMMEQNSDRASFEDIAVRNETSSLRSCFGYGSPKQLVFHYLRRFFAVFQPGRFRKTIHDTKQKGPILEAFKHDVLETQCDASNEDAIAAIHATEETVSSFSENTKRNFWNVRYRPFLRKRPSFDNALELAILRPA